MVTIEKYQNIDDLVTVYLDTDHKEATVIIKDGTNPDIQTVSYEEGQEIIKDFNCKKIVLLQ